MKWEIFKHRKLTWDELISNLNQKSYYNTENYSHYANYEKWKSLKIEYIDNHEKILSACQIFIKSKFFIKIINIPGGIEGIFDKKIIEDLIIFLKKKFGSFTIILCDIFHEDETLINLGSWSKLSKKNNSTIIKDLNFKKNVLLNTYTKNFRHNCKRSNKYEIKIYKVLEPNIEELYSLYLEMESYKKIHSQHSYKQLKNKIVKMKKNCLNFEVRTKSNELISFRSFIVNNSCAWDYLAVTGKKGRKIYASYKLIHHIFEYCIERKINKYDLSGIDIIKNKGVYNFKKGSGGKEYTRYGLIYNSPIKIIKFIFFIFLFFKY